MFGITILMWGSTRTLWGLSDSRSHGLGIRAVGGIEFRAWGLGLRGEGVGLRVWKLEFRV